MRSGDMEPQQHRMNTEPIHERYGEHNSQPDSPTFREEMDREESEHAGQDSSGKRDQRCESIGNRLTNVQEGKQERQHGVWLKGMGWTVHSLLSVPKQTMSKRSAQTSLREPSKKRARVALKPHLYVVVSDDGVYTNVYSFTCPDARRRQKMQETMALFFDSVKTEYAPGYTGRVSKSAKHLFATFTGLAGVTYTVPAESAAEIAQHFHGMQYWRRNEWKTVCSNNSSFWHTEAESVSVFVCKD